ncbi:diphthine methyltransferase, putative [Babesia caballi]|uniref:Diphthine methyltransferase, putative n=1 Tax=Babesia caballi TaxID=5871 RepID=A0AAV4LUQ1_BABCB|nr:diphthine methyltransferase, putative [Babesia caballi]
MEPAENGELIYALPTEGQPDCVKVFPYHLFPAAVDETLKDTIIAATYNYDEVARVRSGGLHALNPCRPLRAYVITKCHITAARLLEGNGGHESAPGIAVTTESLPGVLSCSWIRTPDYYGATCITSDLSVHTFKVEADSSNCDEDRAVCLHERYELFLENSSDAVGLSLTPYECSTSLFAVTASDGTVYVVEEGLVSHKWYGAMKLNPSGLRKAHEVETWSSTFQPGNPNILLTGADDSRIKVFDRRLGVAPQHTLHW